MQEPKFFKHILHLIETILLKLEGMKIIFLWRLKLNLVVL